MLYEINIKDDTYSSILDKHKISDILINLLNDLSIKHEKQYVSIYNKEYKRFYVFGEDKTYYILITLTCDEEDIKFIEYLFKERIKKLETVYKCYNI